MIKNRRFFTAARIRNKCPRSRQSANHHQALVAIKRVVACNPSVKERPSNGMIAAGLVAAIVLWGQNNAATKYLVGYWPPVTIGVSRFLSAGVLLLAGVH